MSYNSATFTDAAEQDFEHLLYSDDSSCCQLVWWRKIILQQCYIVIGEYRTLYRCSSSFPLPIQEKHSSVSCKTAHLWGPADLEQKNTLRGSLSCSFPCFCNLCTFPSSKMQDVPSVEYIIEAHYTQFREAFVLLQLQEQVFRLRHVSKQYFRDSLNAVLVQWIDGLCFCSWTHSLLFSVAVVESQLSFTHLTKPSLFFSYSIWLLPKRKEIIFHCL